MPGMTDYSAQNWLAYITGKTAMPATPQAFVALFTTAPTTGAGVTGAVEVSGGSYARQATTGTTWSVPTASSGTEPFSNPAFTQNAVAIPFPTATANWGTAVAFGLFDAVTSGNLLCWDWLGFFKWTALTAAVGTPSVITSPAHGLANSDSVVFTNKYSGGTLPAAFTSGPATVAGVTTDTFTAGLNAAATGEGMYRKIAAQSIPSGVTASFTINSIFILAA